MPRLRSPRPDKDRTGGLVGGQAARFTETFARRPALPRRGVLPGLRVWATVGAAAGLTTVSVLALPLLARVDLFPSSDADSAASVAAERPAAPPTASASPERSSSPSPRSSPSVKSTKSTAGSGSGSGGGTAQQQSGSGSQQSGSGGRTSTTQSPKASSTAKSSGGSSGSGGSKSTTVPGSLLVSSSSNRCIDVAGASDGVGKDGTRLRIWDCAGTANQKWDFRSDGTVRSVGLCMDVAWGSTDDGAAIQLATCSGNRAQLFYLSSAGDLVSALADKCVDIVDNGTANGTKLQLWTCAGTPNQKWRKG